MRRESFPSPGQVGFPGFPFAPGPSPTHEDFGKVTEPKKRRMSQVRKQLVISRDSSAKKQLVTSQAKGKPASKGRASKQVVKSESYRGGGGRGEGGRKEGGGEGEARRTRSRRARRRGRLGGEKPCLNSSAEDNKGPAQPFPASLDFFWSAPSFRALMLRRLRRFLSHPYPFHFRSDSPSFPGIGGEGLAPLTRDKRQGRSRLHRAVAAQGR
ncbi:uncharacterized protein LOC127395108 [Apus apus]|uniref:uncharacterized protein LOC127395108 n=1 Tax=Apus apus TaxID=8895 RepID=UPI0021F88598|nr:uncharacterized protein LOC127395108 [Apus apus]